jgi:hypothetical protein
VKDNRIALVMAIAVFSHWLIDLVVHTPDLPLWSDSSMKFGLGLWNNAIVTYVLEAALLLGALWLYLKSTTASTKTGKYGMAVSALSAYFLFAAIAFWLEKKRF